MNYPINEHEHTINGVSGRMFTVHAPQEVRGNMVHLCQKWTSKGRTISGYGTDGIMHVNIRFDDNCKNGHQTFSITADVYTRESRRQRDVAACGCLHDEIAKIFPELAPLIKWHLVSTDGPMHYLANTLYHAGDRDCWDRVGKQRDLAAARNAAVWPEATDEQLTMEREELEELLKARLPGLMAEFRATMTACGFLWEVQ